MESNGDVDCGGAVVVTFMWLGRRITGNPGEVLPPVAAKDEHPVQDVPQQAEGLAERLTAGASFRCCSVWPVWRALFPGLGTWARSRIWPS